MGHEDFVSTKLLEGAIFQKVVCVFSEMNRIISLNVGDHSGYHDFVCCCPK